jgi:hypothetical protein
MAAKTVENGQKLSNNSVFAVIFFTLFNEILAYS